MTTDHAEHRKFVGPPERYDLASASQFSLLTLLGLREHHTLLDIGCGSLRAGRLFLPYLLPERYFGIEPNQWLIDQGIVNEIGRDMVNLKKPAFSNDANFTLSGFGRRFDFMVAQSIFSHATQAQIRRCLAQAKVALEPSGIFAATFFIGDSNYDGDAWVYPGRVTYTLDFFTQLAAEAGLACKPINWSHSNEQSWVALTHLENNTPVPDIADASRIAILEQRLVAANEKIARIQAVPGYRLIKNISLNLKHMLRGAGGTGKSD